MEHALGYFINEVVFRVENFIRFAIFYLIAKWSP